MPAADPHPRFWLSRSAGTVRTRAAQGQHCRSGSAPTLRREGSSCRTLLKPFDGGHWLGRARGARGCPLPREALSPMSSCGDAERRGSVPGSNRTLPRRQCPLLPERPVDKGAGAALGMLSTRSIRVSNGGAGASRGHKTPGPTWAGPAFRPVICDAQMSQIPTRRGLRRPAGGKLALWGESVPDRYLRGATGARSVRHHAGGFRPPWRG